MLAPCSNHAGTWSQGEAYDARQEQPGWATPTFIPPAGKVWAPVSTNLTVVAQLNSAGMPPIRAVRELAALSLTKVFNGPPAGSSPCAVGAEGAIVSVACIGSSIKSVALVSFGLPSGSCPNSTGGGPGPVPGTCGTATNLTQWVAGKCVGAEVCRLQCIGAVPPQFPHGLCTLHDAAGAVMGTFVKGEP